MRQATKERERVDISEELEMLLSDFGEIKDLCEMEIKILVKLEIVARLEI